MSFSFLRQKCPQPHTRKRADNGFSASDSVCRFMRHGYFSASRAMMRFVEIRLCPLHVLLALRAVDLVLCEATTSALGARCRDVSHAFFSLLPPLVATTLMLSLGVTLDFSFAPRSLHVCKSSTDAQHKCVLHPSQRNSAAR